MPEQSRCPSVSGVETPTPYLLSAPAPRPEEAQPPEGLLAPPEGPGEVGRFGPYRVLAVLGSGGMGAVFLAEQPHPRRRVALKVSLAPPHTGRRARSRHEPELIARLQHPHMVPVYEAGEHDGRPFFTMEVMEGGSLARRLAGAPLPAREAAGVVEAVARAVHFAHSQGVVHRDLKPSNVLLTADGAPKVSDFGLAKQFDASTLGPGGTDCRTETETGAILGTPAYMAPEQAGEGAGAGPAADVWALGAILYECLTGRPPFKGASVLQTLEQVRSREPVPPSRLQDNVPRDLQTVCLKCLEKDPRRRYGSAGELADDLGRALRGEPVRARPAGAWGRLSKWARRRPAAAALVVVSALSVLTLAAGVLAHSARLRRALDSAEANEAEARRAQALALSRYRTASDTLDRMLSRLEGKRHADVRTLTELRQGLLEDSLAFYQKALAGAESPDPEMRLDAVQAYRQAAAVQQELSQPGPAADNLRKAVALLESLPAEYRDRADARIALADCHNRLGAASGKLEEAEGHYRRAREVFGEVVRLRPDSPEQRHNLALAEHNLGMVYHQMHRPKDAEPHYLRAVELRTPLVRDHPGVRAYRVGLAEDYQDLGVLRMVTGRGAEAGAAYEKAEALLRPVAEKHPDDPEYALALATVYVNWSQVLKAGGRTKEALKMLNEAVERADGALRREPRGATARHRAYLAHGARAQLYEHLGRHAEAVGDWERVIELCAEAERPRQKLARAVALVKAGDHGRATEAARDLAAASDDMRYNAACVYALATAPARADARMPSPEREAAAARYAAEALALLGRLHGAGYFNAPEHARLLRTDTDLEPLRSRPDFRRLLPPEGDKVAETGAR